MTRRAFFVLGAEGSGTNMLAEALVSAGCYEDPRHRQYMDDYEFEKCPDLLMFRRSLPHRGEWPDVDLMISKMVQAEYFVEYLVIFRDSECVYRSVKRRDPDRYPKDILFNLVKAVDYISNILHDAHLISYEAFCLDPAYRKWLFVDRLGLKEPTIEIKYANPKYYVEQESLK